MLVYQRALAKDLNFGTPGATRNTSIGSGKLGLPAQDIFQLVRGLLRDSAG